MPMEHGGNPSFTRNWVVRGYITRDRLWPFRAVPYQCHNGIDEDRDYPGEEPPRMRYYERRRYMDAWRHLDDPVQPPNIVSLGGVQMDGPVAMGRFAFQNRKWCPHQDCARPEGINPNGLPIWNAGWPMHPCVLSPPSNGSGWLWTCANNPAHVYPARAGPPRFNPLTWTKFMKHFEAVSDIGGCYGGKTERGVLVRGSFLLRPREVEGVHLPPFFEPWNFYSDQMTYVPDPYPHSWQEGTTEAIHIGNVVEQVADIPEADHHRFFALLPVPPRSAWAGDDLGPIPYPEGAESIPAIRDARNYEVPCYSREAPWRHVDPSLSGYTNLIEGGQRMILAQSSGPPHAGLIKSYYDSPFRNERLYMCENFWRKYRGITDTTHYKWDADPEGRGWGVSYQATIDVAFVHSYFWYWIWLGYAEWNSPVFRWNLYYTGEVNMTVTGGGDLNDAAFRAWIETHEDRYGLVYEPKHLGCNDVMQECLGLPAMGDTHAPPLALQEEDAALGAAPPCLASEHPEGSKWYVPQKPVDGAGNDIITSQHPITGVRQWPETGLLHEITRTMRDVNGGLTSETQDAWGNAIFSVLGIPQLVVIGDEQITATSEIQRIEIDTDGRPNPDAGEFCVDVMDWPSGWMPVTFEFNDDEADLTQWCNQNWLGNGALPTLEGSWPGEPAITVTRISPLIWEIQYINLEAKQRQNMLYLHDYPNRNTLSLAGEIPDPKYTVNITRVQAGGEHVVS